MPDYSLDEPVAWQRLDTTADMYWVTDTSSEIKSDGPERLDTRQWLAGPGHLLVRAEGGPLPSFASESLRQGTQG